MKKIKIIFFLVILILFALIAAMLSNRLLTKETKYARRLRFSNNELLAIIYIGGSEDSFNFAIPTKYYSQEEIDSFEEIDIGGEEYYLVIPRYEGNIKISSLTMSEDGGTIVSLVKETTAPFFLRCNVSDIFSNSEISFTYKGVEYKYSPYISLKDGSIVTEEFVLLVEN